MRASFDDFEDTRNQRNGDWIESEAELRELLHSFDGRAPFVFELRSESGLALMAGFSESACCAQIGSANGEPPYWMAVAQQPIAGLQAFEFLCGGTLSPIDGRLLLRPDAFFEITLCFLRTGHKSTAVEWAEI